MITASCPQCDNRIEIQMNPEIGQQLRCSNCQTVLVVTWLYPICLDFLDESYPNLSKREYRPGEDKPPAQTG